MKIPTILKIISSLSLILYLSGCNHLSQKATTTYNDEDIQKADFLTQTALENEKNGKYHSALSQWSEAVCIMENRIYDIKNKVKTLSEKHYKNGVKYYSENRPEDAKREFLISLRHNPEHTQSLNFLRNKIINTGLRHYQIKDNDTAESVSEDIYFSDDLAFLVKYVVGRDNLSDFSGKSIELPVLTKRFSLLVFNPEAELTSIKNHINKSEYLHALKLSEKLLRYNPDNKKARYFCNLSAYNLGVVHEQNGNYIQSLQMLNKVSPDFKDLVPLLSEIKRKMIIESAKHYREGMRFYINEDLARAIKEWELTLALNPKNSQVKKDIMNAKLLIQKVGNIN